MTWASGYAHRVLLLTGYGWCIGELCCVAAERLGYPRHFGTLACFPLAVWFGLWLRKQIG